MTPAEREQEYDRAVVLRRLERGPMTRAQLQHLNGTPGLRLDAALRWLGEVGRVASDVEGVGIEARNVYRLVAA